VLRHFSNHTEEFFFRKSINAKESVFVVLCFDGKESVFFSFYVFALEFL
jgi:hypothetical protein